ncbi:MAG: Gfo/Idh/MocA family oxidoreductase [Alphaproteobacteria bacterium]|nr:Gfo/Idh/MocA family oxidoreductase [Alphaproteobacteria bacterium]
MSARPLRAGVIGLGVGEQHVLSYSGIDGVEVRAVCDVDAERLQRVADAWKVAERYEDWRRVTEHPDIDVVSICSYDDCHAEQAISAFRHGKHVMVEKPVALNRRDAEAVLRAQQDARRLITSNLILRRSPRFIELRRMIQAGDFGEIFHIEGDYIHDILWKITEGWRGRMDFYCVVYGGGIHLIDLMRWLIGREIVEVASVGNGIRSRGMAYRYEDCITSLLRFDGGATGKTLTTFGPRRTQLHALNVYGTQRTFVNDTPDARLYDGDKAENVKIVTTPYPGMAKGDHLPDFIAAIREDREPDVGARDVFRVLDVCLAAWEALAARRTIEVSYQI